ncbi:MAG TPA: hypothetical protein VFS43_09645 [Polyangiaceae bacterium]|nr:hypothetical protein [Polyangiaceae bacterium]
MLRPAREPVDVPAQQLHQLERQVQALVAGGLRLLERLAVGLAAAHEQDVLRPEHVGRRARAAQGAHLRGAHAGREPEQRHGEMLRVELGHLVEKAPGLVGRE